MRSFVRHAVFVLVALVSLGAAACSRSDEDTAGGAASATIPSVSSASRTPIANTGSTTGASGVSGSLGESGASGASGASGTSGGATANAVDVTAKEYEFQVDEPVPAGTDGFVLTNEGEMPHELRVLELTGGKTLDDLKALIENGIPKQPPSWVTPVTGTFAKPGTTSKPAIGTIETGNTYVLACFVTTKKGEPHAALGMLQEIQVG